MRISKKNMSPNKVREVGCSRLTKYNYGYTMLFMKTAISIPDAIFKAADKLARRLGFSRSELYTKAVVEYLQKHRDEGVTKNLDEIYSQEPSQIDAIIRALQSVSLDEDDWS
jgi:hypothetical protein